MRAREGCGRGRGPVREGEAEWEAGGGSHTPPPSPVGQGPGGAGSPNPRRGRGALPSPTPPPRRPICKQGGASVPGGAGPGAGSRPSCPVAVPTEGAAAAALRAPGQGAARPARSSGDSQRGAPSPRSGLCPFRPRRLTWGERVALVPAGQPPAAGLLSPVSSLLPRVSLYFFHHNMLIRPFVGFSTY